MSITLTPPLKFTTAGDIDFGTCTFSNFVTTTAGDLLIQTSGSLARLAPGANSTLLTATGSGAVWQNPISATTDPLNNSHIAYNNTTKRFTHSGGSYLLAYKTSSQSFPPGTPTTCLYNVVTYDTSSSYNPATGIYTAPYSGYYLISAGSRYDAQTVSFIYIDNTVAYTNYGTVAYWNIPLNCPIKVNAGQQITIRSASIVPSTRGSVEVGVGLSWFLMIYHLV